jgi:hypothetical protein
MQDSQVMISVILGNVAGQRTAGVAFVDVVLKQIGTMQIPDNDQLSNIESVFYQVRFISLFLKPIPIALE